MSILRVEEASSPKLSQEVTRRFTAMVPFLEFLHAPLLAARAVEDRDPLRRSAGVS